jgi:hypothetical protein
MTEKIVTHAWEDRPSRKRGIALLRVWALAILIGAFAISSLQTAPYALAASGPALTSALSEAPCASDAVDAQHGAYCASVGSCSVCLTALPAAAMAATLPLPASEARSADGVHDSHLRAPPLEPPRA